MWPWDNLTHEIFVDENNLTYKIYIHVVAFLDVMIMHHNLKTTFSYSVPLPSMQKETATIAFGTIPQAFNALIHPIQ
jgi:hypothetical protein